jgi:cytochrome P450
VLGLRSRVSFWLARRYLSRVRKRGVNLSEMTFLPDSALLPLRRNGLDPVPALAQLRSQAPVHKLPVSVGMNVWLVTGYKEAKTVLGDAGKFSNDFTYLVGRTGLSDEHNPGGLGFTDPPVHTRLRRLLTPEFTMRRLARLAPAIDAIVAEQLDAMAQVDGPVDIVREFAIPIPSLVICELLGVPPEDREAFQELSINRFDLFGGVGASIDVMSQAVSALLQIARKQRDRPGDGLLGMIIKEHGDQVDDRELAELADGVLTGGFETTASMLALGILVLLQDPESFELVRDDDTAVPGFVEELLRYLAVVQVAFPRYAREDMEIAGVHIQRGDMVVCSLSGANRDDALGPDMQRCQPARPPSPHLAFGHGVHRCVGAELARMELRSAYPALVRRFPTMRLAVPAEDLSFRKASIVYGLESLPVLLG